MTPRTTTSCKLSFLLALLLVTLCALPARALTYSINVAGGGTLSWSNALTETAGCPGGETYAYTQTNFVYTTAAGTATTGGDGSTYLYSTGIVNECPPTGPTQSVFDGYFYGTVGNVTTQYEIGFTPSNDGTSGSASLISSNSTYQGFVNPKYVVVGVTYAPPGTNSYVNYSGTTSIGNTLDISSSFSNKKGFSVSVKSAAGVPGFGANGTISGTTSTDFTQTNGTSNTTTISKQSSLLFDTPGTGNAFSPVNHDYDTIWLWLNPLLVLTYTPATSTTIAGIQWNGYGYDVNDPSGTEQPDIYPIQVGWLNGDWGSNPSTDFVLGRSWASSAKGYVWPSGAGPGLTGIGDPVAGTDVANILAADPLTNNNYNQLDSIPPITADGRFTFLDPSTNDPNTIPYVQGGPGDTKGITEQYTLAQTNSSSVAQSNSNTTTQEFSLEEVFSGSIFFGGLTATLNQSDTLTWTNSTLSTLTTSTTITDALSVTSPGCTAPTPPVTSTCEIMYSGPGQFVVYQDNQYGTFLFYPTN